MKKGIRRKIEKAIGHEFRIGFSYGVFVDKNKHNIRMKFSGIKEWSKEQETALLAIPGVIRVGKSGFYRTEYFNGVGWVQTSRYQGATIYIEKDKY